MSIFPITPLARRVQAQVLQTFDVSEQEAENYAAMVVSLAEDQGSGSGKAAQLDWDHRVRKDGADRKWRWRSEDERSRFEAAQKEMHQAYEFFISKRNS